MKLVEYVATLGMRILKRVTKGHKIVFLHDSLYRDTGNHGLAGVGWGDKDDQ
jgi:hypothetical protein